MKITKRHLRRIIKEEIHRLNETTDNAFIKAFRDTWNSVRIDVGIPNPTWEDKADETVAMLSTYNPELAKELTTRPFKEQDMLLRMAFDPREQGY